MSTPLLKVENLQVTLHNTLPGLSGSETGVVLDDINFEINQGQSLALVGPSGCGKTLTSRAICGLLPAGAESAGSIWWQGQKMPHQHDHAWNSVRGQGMTMVMQEPASCLNPVVTIGKQIAETIRHHQHCPKSEAWQKTLELLHEVWVPEPEVKANLRPFQLSGGMRQRVLLAAALACKPKLLVADEPTTSLDLTVQKQILELLIHVQQKYQMALLFVTHDENLVPLLADKIARMENGRILSIDDVKPLEQVVAEPVVRGPVDQSLQPVLGAEQILVRYKHGISGRSVGSQLVFPPVNGVNMALWPGRAVGLAGESGCGKSSLLRVLSGHIPLAGGRIQLTGEDFPVISSAARRKTRRKVQLLFQDAGTSLNPRQRIKSVIAEAGERLTATDVRDILAEVGLGAELLDRLPGQLSGGQKKRVALARALSVEPWVLLADEPTSGLDSASRDRVLELLQKIMTERSLALLLVSHDPQVLHKICDHVHVMYRGVILEVYPVGRGAGPRHPYTRSLLAASPSQMVSGSGDSDFSTLKNESSSSISGFGCPWFQLCPLRKYQCENELPPLAEVGVDHLSRCPVCEEDGMSHFIDTV